MLPDTTTSHRARAAWAEKNARALLREAGVKAWLTGTVRHEGDGRWTLRARDRHRTVEISMPGCALRHLKDTVRPDTPRIYVDGSSWFWRFAVAMLREFFEEAC